MTPLAVLRPLLLPPSVLMLETVISEGSSGKVSHAKLRGVTPVAAKVSELLPSGAGKLACLPGTLTPLYCPVSCLSQTFHAFLDPDIAAEDIKHVEEELITEATHLIRVKHPNLVQFMGIVMSDDTLQHPRYILMECADLSLEDRLRTPQFLHVYAVWRLMVDIFSALAYMHTLGIVHGDLKPANILLFNDGHGGSIAKLADLGETARIGKAARGRTPFYCAPELLGDAAAVLEPSCDVYAVGMVLSEVVLQLAKTGPKFVTIPGGGVRAQYSVVDTVAMHAEAVGFLVKSSFILGDVLRRCCDRDPTARITSKQAFVTLKSLKIEKYPPPPLWQLRLDSAENCVYNKDGSVALCRVDTCGNQLREHLIPPNFKKRKGFHGYCSACYEATLSPEAKASEGLEPEAAFMPQAS
jgi:serine/threonine protein kinase